MSKSAVIYWSGTGNTEAMAQAVLDGLNGAGEDAALFSADSVRAADAVQYDKLALGCPAMGAEVLEESVFEPFFTELEPLLSGKKSPSSALTAGATDSGCAIGRTAARPRGRFCAARV